jgi:MFS family permease
MISSLVIRLHQIELFGLYALVFSLPIMESPKHFAIAFFCIGTLGRRLLQRPIKWRKPDPFEWLLLGMWLISLASTLANWPMEPGIHGFKDHSCFLLLFWALYRNSHKESQIKLFLWILIAAVMLGLIEGLWEWKSGFRGHLEFHSAGVVTQSAIYLGVSIFVMFGIFLDTASGFSIRVRIVMVACLLFSLFCLIIMGNRGSVLGIIIMLGLLSPILFHNKRFQLAVGMTLSIIIIMIISAYVGMGDSILKQRIRHITSNIGKHGLKLDDIAGPNDRLRLDHWIVGYTQATQGGHMLLGIGPRNFPSINVDQLNLSKRLATYPSEWQTPSHAHNLFLTKWCEEGILGLTIFILFLSYVAFNLIRHRPRLENIHWSWVACLGALVIPIVAGSFNSPYINEFAWLSMIILGIGMGREKRKQIKNSVT